jgi:VanZ family protein
MDAVLNVFFYVPLGAAGFLSVRRGWLGWLLAICAGTCVSWTVEWLQLWAPARHANLTDLASNTAGTILGATVAYTAVRWNWFPGASRTALASRWRLHSSGTLVLGIWMLWHLFPFIPALSVLRLTGLLTAGAPWSWRTTMETLVGFAILRLAVGRSPWLWIAYAALPAQAFLLDHSLSVSALVGAGLGWALGNVVGVRGIPWIGVSATAWLVVEELRPFSFTQNTTHFAWIPFQSWFGVSSGSYYPVIFGKLSLYVSVLWVLTFWAVGKSRWARFWSVGIPAVILAAGEWTQRYIPGRTPESTDLVLLAAAGILLALCQNTADRA